MSLSVVILTKNEEDNIVNCLENVGFADEIIIIDDHSTDRTIEIIENLKLKEKNYNSKVKIFRRDLINDFAAQRNFGLEKATGRWVIFVDADEIVSEELRSEIIQVTNDPLVEYTGFYIRRVDYLWGKEIKYGETGSTQILRLARRTAGKWRRKVHEVWEIVGKVGYLRGSLIHRPHQSLKDFIDDINRFSELHAQANQDEGKRSSAVKIVIWPPLKFIQNWLFRLGFLDGTKGFVIAMMMSLHSFLAWSKLWLNQKNIK